MNIGTDEIKPEPGRRGVVAVIVRDARLLVIRRSQRVVAPGKLCFPGGAIGDGETEADALVRELDEELGVTIQPERRLWHSVTAWQVEIAWWHARLTDASSIRANPAEVADHYWMSVDELSEHPELLSSNVEFLNVLKSGSIPAHGLDLS